MILIGRLDTSFGKKGYVNVPSDFVQLAGICPVIPGREQLNGYMIADSKGKKLVHVNVHGHFRRVRISMEDGDFARPVQLASNGKYYSACFHPLLNNGKAIEGASVKIFQLEDRT